ncbi:MAG: hypothetical protein U0359_23360 [Byssovorax sp.]
MPDRTRSLPGLAALALLAVALPACNEVASNDTIAAPDPITIAPSELSYPKGPYGVQKGAIIDNFKFDGFVDSTRQSATLEPIAFADFYNPHADDPAYMPASAALDDRLYPNGSLHGEGTPKPRALLVNVAAVWCGPCNEEAKNVFPGKHARYKPCGGEFFLNLAESATQGSPATQKNLASWGKKYKSDFPIVIDPKYQLASFFDASAYPANMIVDPRTMTVVEVVMGVPGESFWQKFEEVLDAPDCLAKN